MGQIIETKKKKSLFKRWWFWVIVILVIIIAAASRGDKLEPDENSTSSQISDTTTADEKTAVNTEKKSNPTITFQNIVLSSSLGSTIVYGEAKNEGDKACSFTLKVSFYNKENKLLGTAVGAINDLNGGSINLFTALASEDYSDADNYKVQVDTMISTSANKADAIEFSNVILKDNSGFTIAEGEAKNNDSKTHSFTVSVGLYDENGKLIGVAIGAINDLEAGDTKTFTTMASEEMSRVKSCKVFVGTLIN